MEYNSNNFLEAIIDYEKVYFHYESVDVLSLAKVIWKNDSLAQELLPFLLERANNKGNRLYTCHTDINSKSYYFVKGGSKNVLVEIVGKSNLTLKLVNFLTSDVYEQVVKYTKMSNVFFEMNSLQEKMFKVRNQLAMVNQKAYLAMFPQHGRLVELLDF